MPLTRIKAPGFPGAGIQKPFPIILAWSGVGFSVAADTRKQGSYGLGFDDVFSGLILSTTRTYPGLLNHNLFPFLDRET